MSMLTCKRCSQSKPEGEFYSSSKTTCKECYKARVRAHRAAHIEHYRAHDKARANNPERVAARAAYAETERGREAARKAKAKWRNQNPEKRAAHIILGNAVRDGRVMKPNWCVRCAEPTPSRSLHAHHNDYAYPLAVEWICTSCHAREHRPF